MRLLLATMVCPRGLNLDAHVALLERAAEQSCDAVVFPELSLTGSVDPRTQSALALELDAPSVQAVVEATRRTGVAAVFGVAERLDGRFHITQVAASDGLVRAVHRKRHLGEDEDAYTSGTELVTFELAGTRTGIAICAEAGVDFPWRDPAAAGARVVLFCAAPGLYGRRTDEAGWRDGFEWWESCGLADARTRARDHGIWVAMTGQAGSTVEEDFPGIAALIGPDGEIVQRLPDWRPGELVVDIPLISS